MASELPEIDGQQSLDDVSSEQTADTEESSQPSQSPTGSESSPAPAEPNQQHRFRVIHERSDIGSTFPHATSTSEPTTWEETLEHVLALGAMLGKDIPAVLAAL